MRAELSIFASCDGEALSEGCSSVGLLDPHEVLLVRMCAQPAFLGLA